ncbi:MAG: nucleoside triphosphate pyrophosphohydrolase [Nitratireductor sp.]|nr:nucleoside triphosphate pyrophosphohydrolase [Nitratireductor sp.]
MKPSRDISRLIEIMAALRTPKTGCPWDLEQDFRSIAPYTIEEAYEVADAIERGDMDDLRLELGDLLLQSVYHARMAEEEGRFDFGDVVEGITAKMIRRHPHVFGDEAGEQYSASGMAKGTWERIKAEEKAETAARREQMGLPPKAKGDSLLDDVPTALPGLTQAVKLQQKASKVGFDWNDPRAVLAKLREEADELEAELATDKPDVTAIGDELGDLLFVLANLARHLEIDPESALRRTNAKFRKRFGYIEKNIEKRCGKPLSEADLDEMEALWQEAKTEAP